MTPTAHWHIEAEKGPLSDECVDRGIISFQSLIEWVEQLPYKRNSNRADYSMVLSEECGTCSTKNALAKAVAIENGWDDVQLFIGIYQLSQLTNPPVGPVLKKYRLHALPEAHTFLRINGELKDLTGLSNGIEPWQKSLSEFVEIQPSQIGAFKVQWHDAFLLKFAQENHQTISEIHKIREECLTSLSY